MKKKDTTEKKPRKSLVDLMGYAYIRRIKKWMYCPACKNGKMAINKKSTLWQCEECGYKLSADEFEDDYVFWFCDECEAYLNNQEGFDRKAAKHICQNCGYENDTTFDNIKGTCVDCGKILPDPEASLCVDCKLARKEKAKQWAAKAGKALVVLGAGALVVAAAISSSEESSSEYQSIPEFAGNDDTGNDSTDDDEVYGLGEGVFPTCKSCGALMTGFDGWAWYTCPVCEDKVRITEDKVTWYDEIFGNGKKQHSSDYALADFCRGGDLSED